MTNFPQEHLESAAEPVLDANYYFREWYIYRAWKPANFQLKMLENITLGNSGLLNAPTGSGKTLAVWIPLIANWMSTNPDYSSRSKEGLKVIWITPLRALAKDICEALQQACDAFNLPWRIETRTGDTAQKTKANQVKQMPECLITTPESLHLLLARKKYPSQFKHLDYVIVDEWHELIGSKRGVQIELGLTRLRALRPDLVTIGISATIGNLMQATEVLMGPNHNPEKTVVVRANIKKKLEMITLLPDEEEHMPWGGHLGIKLLHKAVAVIKAHKTTLIFTNTRSQAEIWYQNILDSCPELAGLIAMHHGSLDRDIRDWVEEALHLGELKAVICTSSLDLGVDFRPVDAVIQVGGPKGVAKFMQRAGRSGHRPGATSKIHFLPTNALELIEAAALREALKRNFVEKRVPLRLSFDVLIQFMVTLAVSEGFKSEDLLAQIRNTYSFSDISDEEWKTCINFITFGGPSLRSYDEYKRVNWEQGLFKVSDLKVARRHRLHIGTIVGDSVLKVRYIAGGYLGTVEEYFAAKLNPSDTFWFAGKNLEFVMIKDMTVLVRKSNSGKGSTPAWGGGRMSFSSFLSELLREEINRMQAGDFSKLETNALKGLMALQAERSCIPAANELLIEKFETREGFHCCVYPFEGRMVHEGMAGLVAWRMAKFYPSTFSISMTDYGFALLSDEEIPIEKAIEEGVFEVGDLTDDLMQSLNAAEMAQRRFRDIACIAGLTFQGYPGKYKKSKHLQASTGLVFKVFADYEPDNLLLRQAYNEVIVHQLEEARMRRALIRISKQKIKLTYPALPTPFSFPIITEMIREKLTTETLASRIAKMQLY